MAQEMINKELLKGTIPLMVLHLIRQSDLYGYQIIKYLRTLSDGVFEFKEGTLYPILHGLEKEKCISSYWEKSSVGRKRKYYKITDVGANHLSEKLAEWNTFQSSVNLVLNKEVPKDDERI